MNVSPQALMKLWISSPSGTFTIGETITGGSSGAQAQVASYNATYLEIRRNTGTKNFTIGETITGGSSGKTATVDGSVKIEWGHDNVIEIEAQRTCNTEVSVFEDEDIGTFGKEVYIASKEQNVGAGTLHVYSGSTPMGWYDESGAVAVAQAATGIPVRFNFLGNGLKVTGTKSGGTNFVPKLEITVKRR